MKTILASAMASLILFGCAINRFDSTEYLQATTIYTYARFFAQDCGNYNQSVINAKQLYQETSVFQNYTVELHNTDIAVSAKILNNNVKELVDHYNSGKKVNPLYCQLKYQIIKSEAKVIQHILGSNPR
jgi:hypothetical protein